MTRIDGDYWADQIEKAALAAGVKPVWRVGRCEHGYTRDESCVSCEGGYVQDTHTFACCGPVAQVNWRQVAGTTDDLYDVCYVPQRFAARIAPHLP